nr:reverse transcriptase domain-containing protein [Tanacetum cinerariifolium]
GLRMLEGGEALADIQFFTPILEWVISKLHFIAGYYLPQQTEEKKQSTRKKQGNTRGSGRTYGSRHHEGSPLLQLVGKSSNEIDGRWNPSADAPSKCRSNLPTFNRQSIPEINWHKLGGIRGRFGNQEPHRTRNNKDNKETIKTLRKINMKLNPKKCTFGVEEGMFLGYMVNTKGIKVCRDKVEGVLSLPSPKCLKDVQRLNGKLTCLNKFLAKSAEKSLPFFKTLKKRTKKSNFQWNMEEESTFKQMKKLIAKLPTLTAPMEKEELIVYLAATREVVSAVLMTKKEANQIPIYFSLILGLIVGRIELES